MVMDHSAVNQLFRSAYAEARDAMQNTLGSHEHPVLVKLDDDLIVYTDGRRETYRILSDRYAWLKTLCHLPLAIALYARQGQAAALWVESLQQHCTQAYQALSELGDAALRDNNQRLLDVTLSLVHAWPHEPEKLQAQLSAYASTVEPLLDRNLQAAAEDELDCLHRTVNQLRRTLLQDTWQRVAVVVCGNHQARYREPAKRYFQALFGEGEQAGAVAERRVLYGEGITDEAQALALLAGQLLDRELGARFRRSPLALQQDVLGEAAEPVIKRLCMTDSSMHS